MTAQIGDVYKYKRKEYTLVALSEPMCFNPEDYGFEPTMVMTACWRGYWCEYEITDKGLFLQKMYIHNEDTDYPELNGVTASPSMYEDSLIYKSPDEKEDERLSIEKNNGHRVYEDINLMIPYSGKMLLGQDFIDKYYIHMGFQRAFAYKRLLEFSFDGGNLENITDFSDIAKKLRKKIDLRDSNWKREEKDILQFIEDSFSLEYETKAWWLEEQ